MPVVDITGRRFSRLLVSHRVENDAAGNARWVCHCDCGNTVTAQGAHLRSGNTKSCGCISREMAVEKARAMGSVCKHGQSSAPSYLYFAWCSMRQRCGNPKHKQFRNYGARGITVCAEWDDFARFAADMGERPTPAHTLDRIDVNGNYGPENCRWATKAEQNNNKRNNHFVVVDGQRLTMRQAAQAHGINYQTLATRLRRGWSLERALQCGHGCST